MRSIPQCRTSHFATYELYGEKLPLDCSAKGVMQLTVTDAVQMNLAVASAVWQMATGYKRESAIGNEEFKRQRVPQGRNCMLQIDVPMTNHK